MGGSSLFHEEVPGPSISSDPQGAASPARPQGSGRGLRLKAAPLGTLVAMSQRAWEEVFGPHHGSPILALCKVTRPPSGLPLQSPVDPLTQINYQAQRAENQTHGDQWHIKEALHLP